MASQHSTRQFVATIAFIGVAAAAGCKGGSSAGQTPTYPIDSTVVKTTTRVLRFPLPVQPPGPNSTTGLYKTELDEVSSYGNFDPAYGAWTYSSEGLPVVPRTDLMPAGYAPGPLARILQFASFFTISDIHITDKEAPNQFIYLQQEDATFSGSNTSIYSPVMPYTTQVLDAAIQTVNALHARAPFDFGLSLGDAANSTSYNELRWYIDVIDGQAIVPSSGAHLGATTVDYQMPYQAAGLDRSIPFYQAIGNHDHFQIGSFPVYADPSLGLAEAYVAGTVWATPDVLIPYPPNFPRVANMDNVRNPVPPVPPALYYQGVIDGSSPTGSITGAGPVGSFASPPMVAADPRRRSLLKAEWIQEFFDTTSSPVGHGFALVDPDQPEGFACYSFLPVPGVPLKVIVLDDTQSEADGSKDPGQILLEDDVGAGFVGVEVRDHRLRGQPAVGVHQRVPVLPAGEVLVDLLGGGVERDGVVHTTTHGRRFYCAGQGFSVSHRVVKRCSAISRSTSWLPMKFSILPPTSGTRTSTVAWNSAVRRRRSGVRTASPPSVTGAPAMSPDTCAVACRRRPGSRSRGARSAGRRGGTGSRRRAAGRAAASGWWPTAIPPSAPTVQRVQRGVVGARSRPAGPASTARRRMRGAPVRRCRRSRRTCRMNAA